MSFNDVRRLMIAATVFTLWAAMLTSLAVAAGPGIHGRVTGYNENGAYLGIVAGADIEFQSPGGGKVAAAKSDKNGYYKADLPTGEYRYKITASGYRTEDAGRGLRVEQSEGYAIFNLALTKGQDDPNRKPPVIAHKGTGTLRGRVIEKIVDKANGIPHARIVLRRAGSREVATVISRSGSDQMHQVGDFETTLEVGTYHASVMASGYEPLIDPQPIEIKAKQETKRIFMLVRRTPPAAEGQGIRGMVTVVDSGSTPPPLKIQIASLQDHERQIPVSSPAAGSFQQDLPPGRYRVTATAEGYPPADSGPVYVFAGRYTKVNLVLRARHVPEPRTVLEVFVFTREKKDAPPTPLANAEVVIHRTGTDPLTAKEATTDSTGHVALPVVDAGEYTAAARLKGYNTGTGTGTVELGSVHEVAIELTKETPPASALALRVVVSDATTKRPLNGVRLLVRQQDQMLADAVRGSTDAQGEANLQLAKAGNYTVLGQLFGYEPGGAKVSVTGNIVNQVAIALRPLTPERQPEPSPPDEERPATELPPPKPHAVSGYVAYRELSGTLRGVPGAKLLWQRVTPPTPPFAPIASTGAGGKYQVNLHGGIYQVRVEPPAGFEPLLEQVQIENTTHEKYFIVKRSERIITPPPPAELVPVKGFVVSEMQGRFTGVTGAEVLFVRADGVHKATSNPDGSLGIQLAAGTYRVHAEARGFAPLDTSVDVRPNMSPLRLVLKRTQDLATGLNLNVMAVERRAGRIGGARTVVGAQVQILQAGKAVASGITDRAGHFTTQVKPGQYIVSVAKTGYTSGSENVALSTRDATVQVALATSEDRQPQPETREGTLTVRVTRRAERATTMIRPAYIPVAGAQVTVMSGSKPVATGNTGGGGAYTVQLPRGSYAVKVSAQGYAPAGKMINVTSGSAALDFDLSPIHAGSTEEAVVPDARQRRQRVQETQTLQQPWRTVYVVEYRANSQARWNVLGTYPTQREAQAALFRAVEHGQISGGAPAESRIRLERRTATGEVLR